jgi:hypothetical protein
MYATGVQIADTEFCASTGRQQMQQAVKIGCPENTTGYRMSTDMASPSAIACSCGQTRETKRLPPGWHRDTVGVVHCPRCWQERYVLRAVTIPVVGPVGATWPELREALKVCWRDATRLANWAVCELAKADCVRSPEMQKLPKPPAVYLYPGAREFVPGLDPGSVVAILHTVEQRYRRRRYETHWRGSASLANYHYPTPYPVRSRDWSVSEGEGGSVLWACRSRAGDGRSGSAVATSIADNSLRYAN